jgi:hypothetical protein
VYNNLQGEYMSEQQDPIALNLQDLAAIKSIIEAASSRGAFKANELAVVGTVYNKLASFLDAAQTQQPQQPQGSE